MNGIYKRVLIALLLLFSTVSAYAHHSFSATFTKDKLVEVEGKVTDFRFRNPHVLIFMDVTDSDGKVTNWMAEGTAATGWRRAGWKNDSIKKGDMLRINGNGSNDGSSMVWVLGMSLLDPKDKSVIAELSSKTDPALAQGQAGKSAAEATQVTKPEMEFIPLKLPNGTPNFSGTTGPDPSWRGSPNKYDPLPPYNDLGKTVSSNVDLANDPQIFCDAPGFVRQGPYTPYGLRIQQYPDHITIVYEEYGGRRAIFFDTELPKPGIRSRMGDSVARYEGDKLIIETVNLLPNWSGHTGNPLSEEARVTEVYTRVDDPEVGSIVEVESTLVDPKFLTEPWTIKRKKFYRKNYEYIVNECNSPLRKRPANAFQYSEFDEKYIK